MTHRCLGKIFWIINILLESKIIFWTLNFYLASKAKGRVHYGTANFDSQIQPTFLKKSQQLLKYFKKFSLWNLKVGFNLFLMNKTVKYICSKNKQKYILIYYYLKIRIIWQNVAKKVLIKWLIRLEMALTDWLLKDATLLTIANQRSRK